MGVLIGLRLPSRARKQAVTKRSSMESFLEPLHHCRGSDTVYNNW